MSLLEEAIKGFGVLGALDTLTGIWEYKLFLLGYYLAATVLLWWIARKFKKRWSVTPWVLSFSALAAFVCTPAVVGIGAAVFVPFPLLLIAQIRWSDPIAINFIVSNLSLLLVFWTAIFLVLVVLEYLKHLSGKRKKAHVL